MENRYNTYLQRFVSYQNRRSKIVFDLKNKIWWKTVKSLISACYIEKIMGKVEYKNSLQKKWKFLVFRWIQVAMKLYQSSAHDVLIGSILKKIN